VKVFKSRLILGVIVTSLFISSCSGTDELVIRERNLQKAIENKVENCDSLYALYSFTSYADIEIFTGDEADENYSKRANLFKKYALEVLEISKLRNHFNKTEYIKELASVTQNVDGTDLPDNTLDRIGQRYFPDCGYFQTVEVFNDPLEQDSQPEFDIDEEIAPDPVSGVDISSLPSGNRNSTAYSNGVEQAESFIATGGLTRATYSNLGGLEQSCKFILDTFMFLSGGASTRQQYADFLLGCEKAVRNWY
jgi:hypothetical protein